MSDLAGEKKKGATCKILSSKLLNYYASNVKEKETKRKTKPCVMTVNTQAQPSPPRGLEVSEYL